MRGQHVTLTIESRLDDVLLLGTIVNTVCATVPLNPEERSLTEVAVVEAVNNCIEHAYRDAPGNSVQVEVGVFSDHILFDIFDAGKSANPDFIHADHRAALDMSPDRPEGLKDGGRGLAIIQQVMQTVEYTPGSDRNRLRLIKRFPQA
jgi:anti-sigma regulatory factor (Ser/Thr protein kinase)